MPAVIYITATIVIWLLQESVGFALAKYSVLVISCPCALGLATLVDHGRNGMGANTERCSKPQFLEETGKTQIVALDKTGTITSGSRR